MLAMGDKSLQKFSVGTKNLWILLLFFSLLLIFLGLLLGEFKEVIKAASHFALWAVGVL